jgi:hypothetical protein
MRGQRWRMLAADALVAAQRATDVDSKALLLEVAAVYSRLAERAENMLDIVFNVVPPPKEE